MRYSRIFIFWLASAALCFADDPKLNDYNKLNLILIHNQSTFLDEFSISKSNLTNEQLVFLIKHMTKSGNVNAALTIQVLNDTVVALAQRKDLTSKQLDLLVSPMVYYSKDVRLSTITRELFINMINKYGSEDLKKRINKYESDILNFSMDKTMSTSSKNDVNQCLRDAISVLERKDYDYFINNVITSSSKNQMLSIMSIEEAKPIIDKHLSKIYIIVLNKALENINLTSSDNVTDFILPNLCSLKLIKENNVWKILIEDQAYVFVE